MPKMLHSQAKLWLGSLQVIFLNQIIFVNEGDTYINQPLQRGLGHRVEKYRAPKQKNLLHSMAPSFYSRASFGQISIFLYFFNPLCITKFLGNTPPLPTGDAEWLGLFFLRTRTACCNEKLIAKYDSDHLSENSLETGLCWWPQASKSYIYHLGESKFRSSHKPDWSVKSI